MFTLKQIEYAHSKVASGADFPKYIQEIKGLGVLAFETWVIDSHTSYFGANSFCIQSLPQYEQLTISPNSNKDVFIHYLKMHQMGETDYTSFCKQCAETGIEKWTVDIEKMTCIYYDRDENQILVETIPRL